MSKVERKRITFNVKTSKSLLNRRKYIDSWFWDRYSINAYQGCQIGCTYCNSRKTKYHLPINFEKNIVVKDNIESILVQEVKKIKSEKKDVVVLCGSTDPYQAAERKYENTRKCLKVLRDYDFPVHIITKSRMVLRDLDILEQIGKSTWCTVSISLSTMNDRKSKFLEPGAVNPNQRLEIIKSIKERFNHVQTGVLAIPIIPFISDTKNEIEELIKNTSNVNSDYFLFAAGLTMESSQAKWFLSKVNDNHSHLIPKYESLYSFKHEGEYKGTTTPSSDYQKQINQICLDISRNFGLSNRIKRFSPCDYRSRNYQLSEYLYNISYFKQFKGEHNWIELAKFASETDNLTAPIDTLFERNYEYYSSKYSSEVLEIIQGHIKQLGKTNNLLSWFE